MMNKNITRKIILLSLIALLLIVYICQLAVTGKNNIRTISFQESPDSLLMVKGSGSANASNSWRLSYENSSWVAGEKKYPADVSSASKMAETLKNIKLLGVIANTPGTSAENYGLSENEKITVTAFKDGKVLRSVVIGKDTVSGGQCYVQVDGKDTVYLAEGGLHSIYSVTLDAVRSKDVYSSAEIISASVTLPEGSYVIRKNLSSGNLSSSETVAAENWILAENNTSVEPAVLDEEKVENWISSLKSLKASEWASENEKVQNENLAASVKLGSASKEILIRFYRLEDAEDSRFLCSSSTSPYLFYVTGYTGEKFCKELSALTVK